MNAADGEIQNILLQDDVYPLLEDVTREFLDERPGHQLKT